MEQQIPLYDMDESERCENLPPNELQNFMRYLDNVRSQVAGQASVTEIGTQVINPKEQALSPILLNNNAKTPVVPSYDNPVPNFQTLSVSSEVRVLEFICTVSSSIAYTLF